MGTSTYVKPRPKGLADLARIHAQLPEIRERTRAALEREDDDIYVGTEIVWKCGMRPGSRTSQLKHDRYGVATISSEHVDADAREIAFVGKKGVHNQCDLPDYLRYHVRRLVHKRGQTAPLIGSNGAHLMNRRLDPLTTQDLRIWRANAAAAVWLASCPPSGTRTERRRMIKQAVAAAATSIQNTPAACKSSYLVRELLDLFASNPDQYLSHDMVKTLLTSHSPYTQDV